MRPGRILHPELAQAVATLGHSDIFMVTDAGFPIPADAWRIDLGFYEGLPDVLDVLRVMRQEVFVEEVHFAGDILTKNKPLYAALQDIFTGAGAEFKLTTHEQLVNETAYKAKFIIRSGSFNPWANIALVASTDPFAWFTEDSGTEILPAYVERRKLMSDKVRPEPKK
ncbi:MAG TPA: D-ribose pyranase [Anaerolineae bacterium]|nr:D-ribose pyranase [Anaerolineae bacterium]